MAIDRNKVIAAAQKHIQKGAYRKAIKEYSKIVSEHPDDVRILLKVGDLQARDGQTAAAAATYNDVADHYVAHGFFLKAVAAYKLLLGVEPNNLDAKLRLADLHFQLGLLRDAMANYLEVASIFNEQGKVDRYLDILGRVVEIDPQHAGNRIQLAEELARFESFEPAADHFLEAANTLKGLGRFEEYTKVMERYVHLRPHDTSRIHDLARVYIDQGRPKRALVRLQPAFQVDPRNHNTVSLLIRSLQDLGEHDRAYAVLEELGASFNEEGDLAARDDVYKRLLELDPEHPVARAALGYDQPAVTFQGEPGGVPAPAVDVDPAAIQTLLDETDVYLKYNMFEKALGHLNGLFALDPENLEGLERRKTALMASGQEEAALGVLIGMARIANRTDHGRAMMTLNQALAIQPDHPAVLAVLAEFSGAPAAPAAAPEAASHRNADPSLELLDLEPVSVTGNPIRVGTRNAPPVVEPEVSAEHLQGLFDSFDMEDTAGGHRVLTEDVVGGALDDPEDPSVLSLEAHEILPADLDMGLDDVDLFESAGAYEEARSRLFELLDGWPEHAELLLRRMEALPSSVDAPVRSSTNSDDLLFVDADEDDGQYASSEDVVTFESVDAPAVPEDAVEFTSEGYAAVPYEDAQFEAEPYAEDVVTFESADVSAVPAAYDDAVEFTPVDGSGVVTFAPSDGSSGIVTFAPSDGSSGIVEFTPSDGSSGIVEFTPSDGSSGIVEFTPAGASGAVAYPSDDSGVAFEPSQSASAGYPTVAAQDQPDGDDGLEFIEDDDEIEFTTADAMEFDDDVEFSTDVEFADDDVEFAQADDEIEFTTADDVEFSTDVTFADDDVEFTQADDDVAFAQADDDVAFAQVDDDVAFAQADEPDGEDALEFEPIVFGEPDAPSEPVAPEAPAAAASHDPFAALESLLASGASQPTASISGASQRTGGAISGATPSVRRAVPEVSRPNRRTVPPLPAVDAPAEPEPLDVAPELDAPRELPFATSESFSEPLPLAARTAISSASQVAAQPAVTIDNGAGEVEVGNVSVAAAAAIVVEEDDLIDDMEFDDADFSGTGDFEDVGQPVEDLTPVPVLSPAAEAFAVEDSRAMAAIQARAAVAAKVDAPIGRASSLVSSTFSPGDALIAAEPDSALAEAIGQRRDGMGMVAMFALQEEESGPHSVAAGFELALANIEMGLFFEGIGTLEQLLGLPDLAQDDRLLVHYYLGIAYEAMDQVPAAQANFQVVAESTPEFFPDVFIRLDRIATQA